MRLWAQGDNDHACILAFWFKWKYLIEVNIFCVDFNISIYNPLHPNPKNENILYNNVQVYNKRTSCVIKQCENFANKATMNKM